MRKGDLEVYKERVPYTGGKEERRMLLPNITGYEAKNPVSDMNYLLSIRSSMESDRYPPPSQNYKLLSLIFINFLILIVRPYCQRLHTLDLLEASSYWLAFIVEKCYACYGRNKVINSLT